MTETRSHVIRAVIVGLLAGSLSGLFGVGGGIILVPGLVMIVGLGLRRAAATSLATVIPIATFGLVGYAVAGQVDVWLALLVTAGALIGTSIGTRLLRVLPEKILMTAFSVLLVLVAVRMFQETGSAPVPDDPSIFALEAAGIGLFTGVLSGLFGVGGGFVIVPALVLLLGEAPAMAKGTSLLAMLPPAILGTYLNGRRGFVDWPVTIAAGLVGAGLSYATAGVSVGLDPAVANFSFAILLLAVALRMGIQAYRHTDAPSTPTASQPVQSRG